VKKNWLQEKVFGISGLVIGVLLSVIGVLMLGNLNRIDKNFDKVAVSQEASNKLAREERNQIRSDIAIVANKQITGRGKIKDTLSTHKTRIELNSEKIKNLEKAVYK
jgi:hypothetical protein